MILPFGGSISPGPSVQPTGFDVEQGIDVAHRRQSQWRDKGWCLAMRFALRVRGEIGQDEELSSRMRPTGCLHDRTGISVGFIELCIATKCISLEDASISGQMGLRVGPAADPASWIGGGKAYPRPALAGLSAQLARRHGQTCLVSRLVRRLARRYPTAEQLSNSGFAALVCSHQPNVSRVGA